MVSASIRPAAIAVSPLRAAILRRSLANINRNRARRWQSQHVSMPNGETYRHQQIKFVKPPYFSMQRFGRHVLFATTIAYVSWSVIRRTGLADIEVELQEEEYEDEEGEGRELTDDDFNADEDSFFLPLTWPKKLDREFYKGSDPEWAAFAKISNDKEFRRELYKTAQMMIVEKCKSDRQVARALGPNVRGGRHFVDLIFPAGPPQQYERWGIELADDYIAWSRQTIDAVEYKKMMRIVWPEAMAATVYASTKMWVQIKWRSALRYLGLAKVDNNAPEERVKKQLEMLAAMGRVQDSKSGEMPTIAELKNAAVKAAEKSSSEQSQSKGIWPLSITSEKRDVSIDDIAKTHVLVHTWRKSMAERTPKGPPVSRGGFILTGVTEIIGDRGKMVFDVIAVYDTNTKAFTDITLMQRYSMPWKQSPRG